MGFFFPWFLPTKPCALRSTQPLKMSTRGKPGVKADEKIRGLNLPGTPRATSACCEIPLLLLYYINVQASYLENTCAHTINGIVPVSLQF